jgi:hypothetical protein
VRERRASCVGNRAQHSDNAAKRANFADNQNLMINRSASALTLLFFTALWALSSGDGSKHEQRSAKSLAGKGVQALLNPAAKFSQSETHGKPIVGGVEGATTFGLAHRGLTQAITLIEAGGSPSFPRSNAARDAVSPFYPNLLDPSDANIALIEQHALVGSDDALAAFLTVAAHLSDYRERSQQLLLLNAARGSVLALTTLSERSLIGFGFEVPDRRASIFFEYLAWSTGHWHSDADSDAFRPTIARNYSPIECDSAAAMGKEVAMRHAAFGERDLSSKAACVDSS